MNTTTTTRWSPTSFQLRLAFNPIKQYPPPPFLSFNHLRWSPKPFYRIRLLSLSPKWAVSSSSDDAFSGWSANNNNNNNNNNNDDDENDNEPSQIPDKKKWPGGIVGAGVAGFVLVAGLTFASLSISKRSTSKPIQEMNSLTSQQEIILTAEDQNGTVEHDESTDKNTPDGDNGVTTTGIENDSTSPTEINKGTIRNTQSAFLLDSTMNHSDAHSASFEDNLKNESAIDSMLAATHISNETQSEKDNVEISDDGLVTEKSESSAVSEEYLNDANPVLDQYQEGVSDLDLTENSNPSPSLPSNSSVDVPTEPVDDSYKSVMPAPLETQTALEATVVLTSTEVAGWVLAEENSMDGDESTGETSVSPVEFSSLNEQDTNSYCSNINSNESNNHGNSFSSAGIPAPSSVSAALQVSPGKVLVPAVVDLVQGQALSALQVLKVIEGEVQPGDLCTRREYARWLLSASSTLSRNTAFKVYPAMYIENVTELAFHDITPEDPDFPSIQGLAEAGLISSRLSRRDLASNDEDPSSLSFFPESPLSRQDLVTWKMALEKGQLPEADKKVLHQLSGFLDIDKINPDAWPALVADLSAGENGITALAFGFTRLFQPEKPVTKAQAAIALATGEYSDIVCEELARIEAESIAEKAVSAHTALVAQVEKDVNATFEQELLQEREKVNAVTKMAEEARRELERLREEREREGILLMKERAAVESEMEVFSRLRHEVEEQMESLLSNKVEITFEKERLSKLSKEAEFENQEIIRLQRQLEVERKALSMARAWAEDEAKRAREQAKVLEGARERWEKHGIKVVVDNDLREEENVGVTWLDAGTQFSVDKTVNRAVNLTDKLKAMAADANGKAKVTISTIIEKIQSWILVLKEWALKLTQQGLDFKNVSFSKMGSSFEELRQTTAGYTFSIKEGARRVAEDCKEGVEKLTQKFKT